MPVGKIDSTQGLACNVIIAPNARVVFPGGPQAKGWVCKPPANKAEYIIKQGDAGLGG